MTMRGILVLLAMSVSGCTTTDLFTMNGATDAHKQTKFSGYEHHYLFEPSPVQMANAAAGEITDQHILDFSENVKEALRRRMNRARLARMFSGTIQVLTAATAAGLGAVSANIDTITALAGTSAVMPQLQELFGARERAQYYEQGASLVEQAQGRYFGAIARGETKLQDPPKISLAAVALFNETVAAITVVEKALVDRLPTVEELQKATGAYTDLKFAPEAISVDVGTEVEALIGGTATVGSVVVGDPQKARATLSGRTVKIKGLAGGGTQVIATDALGKAYLLAVTVAPAAAPIDPVDPILAVGADLLVTVSASLSANPEVEDTATATATLVNPHLLRIHGVKTGATHMVITDGNAQPYKFPVKVQAAANAN